MNALAGNLLILFLLGFAHPVPKENHDRRILVRVHETGIEVLYRLEVDEARAVHDLIEHDIDLNQVASKNDLHRLYLDLMGRRISRGLILKGPPGEIPLTLVRGETLLTDHLRVDLYLQAPRGMLAAGIPLELIESNYAEDARSLLLIHLWPGLQASGQPKPRSLSFTAEWKAEQENSGPPVDSPPSAEVPSQDDGLVDLLLGGTLGLPALLGLSFVFGAGHALTPGHGKTMVAAYLVGERGTIRQAILLGLVTTLTHTSAVMVVAAVLPWLVPDASSADVQRALNLIGGFLLCSLGFWLFLTRLTGGADHYHGPGGHTHGPPPRGTGTWGVIILGITGGLIPCWDAVAMLVFAMASGRIGLALPLLFVFSLGLASVLVALGISVVKSRDLIQMRVGTSGGFERWTGRIALLSAAIISAMGIWLCHKAATGA